jgi:hypothetical protein
VLGEILPAHPAHVKKALGMALLSRKNLRGGKDSVQQQIPALQGLSKEMLHSQPTPCRALPSHAGHCLAPPCPALNPYFVWQNMDLPVYPCFASKVYTKIRAARQVAT